ncbi:MAG: erythromycin esterase [Acidobacteriota bacterium]|jgi:erythromycin esterase-like protein|nr:erythromycin esterase [Acidobacteriota bacterium]
MKLVTLSLIVVLSASVAGAQDLQLDEARKGSGYLVKPGIWRLDGNDPTLEGTADLEPLRQMIGEAKVVALGESYHTSGGLYLMKHRIFRFLVENMGFRAFAIESYWQGAEAAERYVETCQGDPLTAIREHINVWQSTEYGDLVQWMCEWNSGHPDPADKVTLFGFDIQQPWYDGRTLIAFLDRIGIRANHEWVAGIRSCEAVIDSFPFGQIPQARHDACIQALNAVEGHLDQNRADIVRRMSQEDFEVARLRAVGLRAWEDSVFIIAHDFAAGYNARDEGMAYAFFTMQAMKAPGAKTVVWADNSHVARNTLPTGERPLGSYLATALGKDYVTFALAAYQTDLDYAGFCGPVDRTAGSVEDRLQKLGREALLVNTTKSRYLKRATYTMGTYKVRPHKEYNGIIWLKHSTMMHPLLWPACP